ncbi:uncharacterized protein LOC101888190 [Musca domestica]|uniref:Uncharacterized protein LOC101888190 n=1 Tax=Musca domestica TaxID=7370 RepID=A0ABM3VEM4_MUSDO|nr:uncharacterized protein LOC101888190 [Musca domestica]
MRYHKVHNKIASACNYIGTNCGDIYLHTLQHFPNNKKVKCPLRPCKKTFASQNTFRSHFFRKHSDLEQNLPVKQTANYSEVTNSDKVDGTSLSFTSTTDISPYLVENSITNILTQLKCKFNVSEDCLHSLFTELISLLKQNIDLNIRKIRDIIGNCNVSNKENEIVNFLKDSSVLKDLQNISSKQKIQNFFSENPHFIGPQEIFLGVDNCHYVPLLETLNALFSDQEYLNFFSEEKKSDFNSYLDYNDGLVYKNQKFFNSGEKRIELLIFQDAFEMCNPLGSAKRKHKVTGFYFMLGNIDIKYRSIVKNIRLLLLCKERYIKTFGFDIVLQPLLTDLKKLETAGLTIYDKQIGKEKILFGQLFMLLVIILDHIKLAVLMKALVSHSMFAVIVFLSGNPYMNRMLV